MLGRRTSTYDWHTYLSLSPKPSFLVYAKVYDRTNAPHPPLYCKQETKTKIINTYDLFVNLRRRDRKENL